jgi:hypothetical protein
MDVSNHRVAYIFRIKSEHFMSLLRPLNAEAEGTAFPLYQLIGRNIPDDVSRGLV